MRTAFRFRGLGLLLGAAVCSMFLASCRLSAESTVKHVVLISIDTCRADHLGCYGYGRQTSPNIDRVAEEGVLFTHAVSPVPITLPAHSSMLTGVSPLTHRVRDNERLRLPDSQVTITEVLREEGYATGAAVGAFVLDSRFGLDQGFQEYDDDMELPAASPLMYEERSAEEVSKSATSWLREHHEERFFLFLHYYDPHQQYTQHEQFVFSPENEPPADVDRYDSEIAYVDRNIGEVINQMKELDIYDSSLLIITSDHGEGLGEHSENTHSFFIYQSTLRVPLIIKVPEGPRGKRVKDVAGLIDILPTICGMLNIDVPPGDLEGNDLSPYLRGEEPADLDRYLYCESLVPTKLELYPLLGLVGNRWKYIHSPKPELYDVNADPSETVNVSPKDPSRTRWFYDRLARFVQDHASSAGEDGKLLPDEDTAERLRSLGYLAGYPIQEEIRLDSSGADAKDFIELYNFHERMVLLSGHGQLKEAKRTAEDMLVRYPQVEQIYYYLGSLATLENDTKLMIAYFERYLDRAGTDGNASVMSLGRAYELGNAHSNLGSAYLQEGRLDDAAAHVTEALRFLPDLAEAHYNQALIYTAEKDYPRAVTHYETAIREKPDFAEALNNLALIHATVEEEGIHRPRLALELAMKACELTGFSSFPYLDTLSIASAAAGDFASASEIGERASEMAYHQGQARAAERIRARIRDYRTGPR